MPSALRVSAASRRWTDVRLCWLAVADLEHASETVVRRCLGVQPGEDVLVITDPATREIGEVLRDTASAAGADAVLTVMTERAENGVEPPPPVAAALAACDVFIAPTAKSLSHTSARKAANDAGARGATLPTVTADMLARLMSIDFDALAERCRRVADLLTASQEAHITCPRGTDLRLDLSGRDGIADDGLLTQPGAFGNLPCGEGFISPASGSGTAVVASLASIGLPVGDPPTLTVTRGHLVAGTQREGALLLSMLQGAGEQGTNLAELGVGTNDAATLTGNVLEDEKILGTVHIAFGASAGIGGTVSVPVHLDVVIVDASLTLDGTPVLDAGRFVL
jgi:leucyl aminopeptidase (aminopeptidase T)